MEKSLSVAEIKKTFAKVLREAAAGVRITVTRHDRPIALIISPAANLLVGRRSKRARLTAALPPSRERASLAVLLEDRNEQR